jgi:hypothetical protein
MDEIHPFEQQPTLNVHLWEDIYFVEEVLLTDILWEDIYFCQRKSSFWMKLH